jgi:hypothetical protein
VYVLLQFVCICVCIVNRPLSPDADLPSPAADKRMSGVDFGDVERRTLTTGFHRPLDATSGVGSGKVARGTLLPAGFHRPHDATGGVAAAGTQEPAAGERPPSCRTSAAVAASIACTARRSADPGGESAAGGPRTPTAARNGSLAAGLASEAGGATEGTRGISAAGSSASGACWIPLRLKGCASRALRAPLLPANTSWLGDSEGPTPVVAASWLELVP